MIKLNKNSSILEYNFVRELMYEMEFAVNRIEDYLKVKAAPYTGTFDSSFYLKDIKEATNSFYVDQGFFSDAWDGEKLGRSLPYKEYLDYATIVYFICMQIDEEKFRASYVPSTAMGRGRSQCDKIAECHRFLDSNMPVWLEFVE